MAKSDRQRAAWGTITRGQVIEAAIGSVKAGKYEQMTIRGLAADLGVSPMALYNHVRDKDDLLDEVVDRLFARRWRPRSNPSDWLAWTKEAAERFRTFLVDQPVALHVYLNHPVVSPTAILRMSTVLEVLGSAGFTDKTARRIYGTIHTYTIGFAALESTRASTPQPDVVARELADELASFTTPRQFSEGLTLLLEGIERRRLD